MESIYKVYIDKNKVLKFLGYSKRKPSEIILRKIDEECDIADKFIKPQVSLKQFEINHDNNQITIADKYVLKGKYAFDRLKDCKNIYIALYTIGTDIEERIKYYTNNNEMIRGMVLDKIGIVALDYINDKIKYNILNQIPGLKISSEIYPGESDFDVSNQKIIFDLLKNENSNIRINEHYQLFPIKTVGVIFGVGLKDNNIGRCDNCKNKCY
ncbi:hypothetical protein [Tepidibacter hydrothermalis]|uniref:Vitamin B12 dependent methionine synthase, activation domain n=1 Tax=Tepidibacter hydrothermalis TaxID=3036126 RepID=A0ABY8EEC1_9FIRM|nr:hypothetical protein [Tepidibacter hydrothermalis]WFD11304.1 hypothetical protein P4S50_04295 [Tepidibacter hydrothermalis]